MFVVLSKTLDWFLSPLSWAFVAWAVTVFRSRGKGDRRALGVLVAGGSVLFVFSTPLMATWLMSATEAGATRTYQSDVVYDAVIVLGGSVSAEGSVRSGQLELNAAGERVLKGYELLRTGRAGHVLLSAGALVPKPGVPAEAELLSRVFQTWGLPPERIVSEPKSRNTRENAVESARIIAERGWKKLVLVTSAAHMPRAVGCFRAVGLEVDTLPVDHRAGEESGALLPRAGSLAMSSDAVRELAGRLVYRLRGYSK